MSRRDHGPFLGHALGVLVFLPLLAATGSAQTFEECPLTLETGKVACMKIESAALGGTTAFSYYLPPGCASAGARCPTLYLLHGFGGDYLSMLGTADEPSAWVRALSAGPAVDPSHVPDPWSYGDPDGWIPLPAIDLILVAPHGATVPGGYGPEAGLDGFWTNWNPRYAAGGNSPKYATPPPRFESFLVDELIPFVEEHFPAGAGRAFRALAGRSLGGYGSFRNGLRRPDVWSTIGSVSGAHNFLFAPAPNPLHATSPVGLTAPVPLPYASLPGVAPMIPISAYPDPAKGFVTAFFAFGDTAADEAYFRGQMPRDLAMNGRASAGGEASLHLRFFCGDAVPRRAEDFAGPGIAGDLGFEALVLPMNVAMDQALHDQAVEHDELEIHPGLHSWIYSNAFLRGHIAAQYARLRHRDGTGSPPPAPTSFDYRTIDRDFTIWDWSFHVERGPVEFLNLRGVSCDGLTLQGSGKVTITVPASCGTGLDGSPTLTVDLGNPLPADEHGGASALPVYGTTVVKELEDL